MCTKRGSVPKSDSYPMAPFRCVLHRDSDLAGIDGVLQDIHELIEYPLTHPEIYTHIGIDPPRGILLHGPPGCGKTLLARAVGGELGIPLISISAPEIVSGMSGESEEKVRLFQGVECSSANCSTTQSPLHPPSSSSMRSMQSLARETTVTVAWSAVSLPSSRPAWILSTAKTCAKNL